MKQTVKILVQGQDQTGAEFAQEITNQLELLKIKAKDGMAEQRPELKFMTTASDGRQTATIILNSFE